MNTGIRSALGRINLTTLLLRRFASFDSCCPSRLGDPKGNILRIPFAIGFNPAQGAEAADADPRPSRAAIGAGRSLGTIILLRGRPAPYCPIAARWSSGPSIRVVLYRDLPKLNAVQSRDGRRSSDRRRGRVQRPGRRWCTSRPQPEQSVVSRSRGRGFCGAVDPRTCGKSEAVLFTQKVAKGGDRARSFEDCLAVEVWLTGGDHGYAVHGPQRAVQGVR